MITEERKEELFELVEKANTPFNEHYIRNQIEYSVLPIENWISQILKDGVDILFSEEIEFVMKLIQNKFQVRLRNVLFQTILSGIRNQLADSYTKKRKFNCNIKDMKNVMKKYNMYEDWMDDK